MRAILTALCLVFMAVKAGAATEIESYGEAVIHYNHYTKTAPSPHQDSATGRLYLSPVLDIYQGEALVRIAPDVRVVGGHDAEVDWQESYINLPVDLEATSLSLTIGSDIAFWGKTEIYNPSDIINTQDFRAGLRQAKKRGMPMVRLSGAAGSGELSLLLMPIFQPNLYPYRSSRENLPLEVADSQNLYGQGTCKNCLSVATRWEGYVGNTDIGLSYFDGTGREPTLAVGADMRMTPTYHGIRQAGVDIQHILGETLVKADVIHRAGQPDHHGRIRDYTALSGGIEHTLYGIFDSNADAGLLAEAALDSRGVNAHNSFQRDLFGGVRLVMNDIDDSTILAMVGYDMDYHSRSLTLSGERRLADGLVASASLYVPRGMAKDRHSSAFTKSESIALQLSYSW